MLGIRISKDWLEISREDLNCGDVLGSGAFGVVKKGLLKKEEAKEPLVCAVKMLKGA